MINGVLNIYKEKGYDCIYNDPEHHAADLLIQISSAIVHIHNCHNCNAAPVRREGNQVDQYEKKVFLPLFNIVCGMEYPQRNDSPE